MRNVRRIKILILFSLYSIYSIAVGDNFDFALITDIHISKNETSVEDLKNSVLSINNNPSLQFVLVSGDITEGGDNTSLIKAKQILDDLKVPYFAIPGNHETKWSESGVTDFRKIFGDDRFYFEHNNFVFIGFNSGPIIRMMDGHIGTQDIIWLKEKLEDIDKDKKIIIVTHYPLQDGDVDNWYEATDLIRQHNVKAILGGHYHKNMLTFYDGIPAFINRSNLRGKDAFGAYSTYSITEDSICVSEQIINEAPRKWGGYSLKKQYYSKSNSGYLRPSYAVNSEYPKTTTKWILKNDAAIYSSPVIYKNNVYVGDDNGNLSCFSLKNGNLLWQFKSDSRILGTAAAEKDVVVFGSTDHYIYGINAISGKKKWKIKADAPVLGAVTIENGKAYIGSSDHTFRSIDIKTGEIIWQYKNIDGYIETRPLIYNNKVIFGAWDSYLYALDKNSGNLIWKWNNGTTRMHFSPAAVWSVGAHGKVFFSAPDRFLTALDAKDGKIIWRTKESMVRETIGLSEDNKRIYSKTMQDSVVCYSATTDSPEKIWSVNVGYGYDHAPSMLVEKDNVVFGSTKNGLIFALDAFTGKILWKHKVGNSLISTIVPLSNKECVFTSAEGYIGILQNEKK